MKLVPDVLHLNRTSRERCPHPMPKLIVYFQVFDCNQTVARHQTQSLQNNERIHSATTRVCLCIAQTDTKLQMTSLFNVH